MSWDGLSSAPIVPCQFSMLGMEIHSQMGLAGLEYLEDGKTHLNSNTSSKGTRSQTALYGSKQRSFILISIWGVHGDVTWHSTTINLGLICPQGVMESFLGTAMAGSMFCLFAGQPLIILSSTGPILIFEKLLFDFSK